MRQNEIEREVEGKKKKENQVEEKRKGGMEKWRKRKER